MMYFMRKLLQIVLVLAAVPAYAWNVGTEATHKSVIIEEFTGIHCGNCPDGHKRAAALQRMHPDNLFVVAIHAGSFATSYLDEPDFVTKAGELIHNHFGVSSYPSGIVNRRDCGNGMIISRSNWGSAARVVNGDISPVNLYAECSYDNTSRELTVNVEGYYTSTMTDPRLTLMLLQDNILGPQSGGLLGDEYPHRHMLRAVLTEDAFGDRLDVKEAGEYFSKEYRYTLPEAINSVPLEPYDTEVLVFVAEGEGEIVKATALHPDVKADDDTRRVIVPSEPHIGIGNTYALDYLELILDNYTGEYATSAKVDFTLNETTTTLEWAGSVAPHSHGLIKVPFNGLLKETYDSDLSNYSYIVTEINGKPLALETKKVKGSFKGLGEYPSDLVVKIKTDIEAADNTYRIIDEDGNTVHEFGPYADGLDKEYEETVNLEPGKVYGFEVTDCWGNGVYRPRGNVKMYDTKGNLAGQLMEISDSGVRTFFRAVVPAGIDNVCSSAKVVEEEFYDLAGRKVAGNTSGIYICRSRLSDGSVEVKKIKK